jgi:ribonuclease HI
MAIIRAPKKSKWYVVWIGHAPGLYPSWDKCRPQVEGFPGARYRAYDTLAEARAAYEAGPPTQYRKPETGNQKPETGNQKPETGNQKPETGNQKPETVQQPATSSQRPATTRGPIYPSVCVDAACNMETRVMEYRGVDTQTGKELFRMGPYNGATNNMGEFLALVHALSLLARDQSPLPIYSDSKTALAWVRNKHAKTTVNQTAQNREVFALIHRAEQWLKDNTVPNRVLKWETEKWGENPADFGRK